jgi:hypothetical protein
MKKILQVYFVAIVCYGREYPGYLAQNAVTTKEGRFYPAGNSLTVIAVNKLIQCLIPAIVSHNGLVLN